jgi:hypothetical protein
MITLTKTQLLYIFFLSGCDSTMHRGHVYSNHHQNVDNVMSLNDTTQCDAPVLPPHVFIKSFSSSLHKVFQSRHKISLCLFGKTLGFRCVIRPVWYNSYTVVCVCLCVSLCADTEQRIKASTWNNLFACSRKQPLAMCAVVVKRHPAKTEITGSSWGSSHNTKIFFFFLQKS